MENEFKQVMSERTDEELIKIITAERDSYNPFAIEAAESEIEKRNIDTSKFEEIREKTTTEKELKKKVDSNVVGSGIRFLNFIIDFITGMILATIIGFIFSILIVLNDSFLAQLFVYFMFFGIFFFYYSIMEIKFQKTVGKFVTKTKVVKLDGEKPNTSDIITRTFCRFIPFDRISFLFVRNGIHDYLSKTKVVKDNSELNSNANKE